MKFPDFRKSCIFMPKDRFEPSNTHSLCVLSLYVPGNVCNGCFGDLCKSSKSLQSTITL